MIIQARGRGRRFNRRAVENKHSTDIGACVTFSVNAHTGTRRRRCFNDGGVLVLN
jgi:hypothetical protein